MLATFKFVPRLQIFFTYYHGLLLLITPYHTLSPRLERKQFYIGNFKISSQAVGFLLHLITPCYSLLHLITPYALDLKKNNFTLASFKLVPRPQFFITSDHVLLLLLITPYHTLSPRCETKRFYVGNFKINSQGYRFIYYILLRLVTPFHTLSHLIPYNRKKTILCWQL